MLRLSHVVGRLCLLWCASAIAHHHTPVTVLSAIFSTPQPGKTQFHTNAHFYSTPESSCKTYIILQSAIFSTALRPGWGSGVALT